MIKIGGIKLGQVPRIALVIGDRENLRVIGPGKVDFLELRVDQFQKTNPAYVTQVIKSRKKTGLPLILTIRAKKEGGRKSVPDKVRIELFNSVITLVDAVDIELNSVIIKRIIRLAHSNKKPVIASYHNFKITPDIEKLKFLILKAKRQGADIVKIAVKANKMTDVTGLLELTLKYKQKNLITISLGNIGVISRLFFPLAGSLLNYAYLNKPSASGQLPLSVLRQYLSLYYPAGNTLSTK